MVIIPIIVCLELFRKVFKGMESMSGIESFIVFPVAAVHLAVVSRGIRLYELMADAVLFQTVLKLRKRFSEL